MTAIIVRELRPGEMPVLAALYGASFDEPYPEPVAARFCEPLAHGAISPRWRGRHARRLRHYSDNS